ncbi:Wiskott-Aldrich syndrome like protein [Termitomyces sp. T112]|nr:Wiskott-Aldrich syndrome like protein [Termitomyces sp. T112]
MMSQLMSAPYPPVLELRPSTVVSGLAPDSYTIIAVANARIYHANLGTKTPEWCYSRMRGILVFGRDCEPGDRPGQRSSVPSEAGNHWFRLLDATSGKPVWLFKIPIGFVYELDRPFFHAFQGKSRRFGFLFDDDDEASILAKKVVAQTCPPRAPKNRSLSFYLRSKSTSDSGRSSIQPSMVSLPTPNSFVHVAHVGLNKDGVIEATAGIDPSWRAILEGYSHHDFDEPIKVPEKKISFGDGFWRNFDREGGYSRAASTTELSGHRVVSQEKIRRRMPSPSFTIL